MVKKFYINNINYILEYLRLHCKSNSFHVYYFSVDCNSVSKNEIGYSACYSFEIDDGPCNFDEQCKETLICGYKNCPSSFDKNHNCCTKNELLKSPNYPMNYPPYVEKNWLITASFGSIINLQFQSFQVRLIIKSINQTFRIISSS